MAQLRTGFEVHHKDGDPTNNAAENLIALCRPCHNLREGNKPSINEIELMQQQIAGSQRVVGEFKFIRTREEANQNFRRCDDLCIPTLEIRQISRRKYAEVQVDLSTTRGWKQFVRPEMLPDDVDPVEVEPETPDAVLTESAVSKVNSLFESYRSYVPENVRGGTTMTSHGSDFVRYPPLEPERCHELGHELAPIVTNRSNWEPHGGWRTEYVPYDEFITGEGR